MSSYWRDCNVCGQKIVMVENGGGYWQPLEPDGSGRHKHWSGTDYVHSPVGHTASTAGVDVLSTARALRPWRLESLGHPLTRPTKCWWCGEPVFFHTNGNGDCVLLDGLRRPWPVHGCWEQHCLEQRHKIQLFEDVLFQSGYDGQFIETGGPRVTPPLDGSTRLVTVHGFIADNHALYKEPDTFDLSLDKQFDLFLTVYSSIFLQNRGLRNHSGGVAPGAVSPPGADGSTC